MSGQPLLGDSNSLRALAERLARCPGVTRLDEETTRESWTLAHAFSDLDESFRRFSNELLPKLMDAKIDEATIYDILMEIGEEFRHVLYHLRDPRFYRYLDSQE